jgi:hypothetical protein
LQENQVGLSGLQEIENLGKLQTSLDIPIHDADVVSRPPLCLIKREAATDNLIHRRSVCMVHI